MLTAFGIKNFKSYKEATLPLAPLTVLIGANASGKSNAIEALRLLSWIAQGNRLTAIRYALYEGVEPVRGTVANLGHNKSKTFELTCRNNDEDWDFFSLTLSLGADDELHISDERITGPGTSVPLYEVVGRFEGVGSDLQVAYNNFARGGKKPRITCNDQMAILNQLQSSAVFEIGHKSAQREIPVVCDAYSHLLSGIVFLDPRPSAMRYYSFKTETELKSDGSNLSGVLFSLCKDSEKEAKILDNIQSLPEQNIAALRFIETPRNEAMIELVETFGGQEQGFDATLLSDGTLRVLAVAAAILSAPRDSLVVIEEIDNGIHPSRAHAILGQIARIARERDLRVLISSHNPALLDALPDDAVPDVVFCYRDPQDGSSCLVRLADIPDYPELIAQGSVGHLMTRGLIDRFVKSDHSPEAKQEKFDAWLEQLRAKTG